MQRTFFVENTEPFFFFFFFSMNAAKESGRFDAVCLRRNISFISIRKCPWKVYSVKTRINGTKEMKNFQRNRVLGKREARNIWKFLSTMQNCERLEVSRVSSDFE